MQCQRDIVLLSHMRGTKRRFHTFNDITDGSRVGEDVQYKLGRLLLVHFLGRGRRMRDGRREVKQKAE